MKAVRHRVTGKILCYTPQRAANKTVWEIVEVDRARTDVPVKAPDPVAPVFEEVALPSPTKAKGKGKGKAKEEVVEEPAAPAGDDDIDALVSAIDGQADQ